MIYMNSTKEGVLAQVTDYTLTDTEEFSYMSYSEEVINKVIKAPSTAEYPGQVWNRDQWKIGRDKELIQISSYVDSQNSFGAMIRSEFTIQLDYSTGGLLCVIFDGEVVYGEI